MCGNISLFCKNSKGALSYNICEFPKRWCKCRRGSEQWWDYTHTQASYHTDGSLIQPVLICKACVPIVWPINSLQSQTEPILAVSLQRVKTCKYSSFPASICLYQPAGPPPTPTNDALDALNVFVVQVWKGGDNLGVRDKEHQFIQQHFGPRSQPRSALTPPAVCW